MLADLHLHSRYSDGSDTVEQLFQKLSEQKIEIFSLTDHDSIRGTNELAHLAKGHAKAITGVEFSCLEDGLDCHILGYGFSPEDKTILELLQTSDMLRLKNFENRKEHLETVHGIFFTESELSFLHSLPKIGKPHIAKVLVNRGLAKDTSDVISRYLNGCKAGDVRLPASEVIPAIVKAGGIPVWAHPLGGEGERHREKDEVEFLLRALISYGLRGMECYYSRYTKQEIEFLLQKANENDLAISGGSDYHGENKTVPLGALCAEKLTVTADMLTVLDLL